MKQILRDEEVGEIKKHIAELLGEVDTLTAEVERLRAELVEWKERCQRNSDEAMSWMGKHDSLRAQLAERDALLSELAEAAEVFSCSAHCETSDAGDALGELNKNLARVNAHKAPKCRVCGHKLHAEGYCSFRDCGVPGRGTKALSASAEPKKADQ